MPGDPTHPRPLLQRRAWGLLDGDWDFALDPDATITDPAAVVFDRTVTVPFAPETPASGIGFDGFLRRCWYRRAVPVPADLGTDRFVLHFGAVDREATVWADGHRIAHHVGGWTPFAADLTDVVTPGTDVAITVRADDLPRTVSIPRGKQDWHRRPHAVWYPRTTGIWQSVWFEQVPAAHIAELRWTGDPRTLTVDLEAHLTGDLEPGATLRVVLRHGERLLADDTFTVAHVTDGRAVVRRRIGVGDGGVDDAFALVWRPGNPALLDATVTLSTPGGATDEVGSYAALRSVEVADGRFVLNGRPHTLRLALDQGYWPETGMTAPSVDALRADVELIRSLGLSGVRKHQKLEDPRWLAACDEAGVLVWEELPSAYPYSVDGVAELSRTWTEAIERDRGHPCIVAWVPVNESWGVPWAADDPAQRAAIGALAALTRALDPTRPISANDGWETVGGDLVGIHDYDQDADRVRARYATAAAVDALFDGLGPSRRILDLDGRRPGGRAVVLSEFGGTTMVDDPSTVFGYGNVSSPAELVDRVRALCRAATTGGALAGFCWTQLTDTYQEVNGLVRMDRTPKAPIEELRAAILGR